MENRIDVEKKYNEWIDKACEFVDKVGPLLNMPVGSMQSDISLVLGNKINIMFLGHDAHEADSTFIFENSNYFRDRCKTGNICWKERNDKWAIWKNLRDCFRNELGDSSLMDDMNHIVFTNAIFFTGNHITEVLDQIGTSVETRCMELTRDLIFDILHPKLLVCFSVNDVFDKLIDSIRKKEGFIEKSSVKKFKPYHIKHTCAITQVNGTIIQGIPHPSGAHGVLASLPAIVRIINDLSQKEEIENIVATKELFLNSQEARYYKMPERSKYNKVRKEQINHEKSLKVIIEDCFKKDVRKASKDDKWYSISPNFIIRVTSAENGYVSIRDSQFKNGYDYIKNPIKNQNAIISFLQGKGYELKSDGARRTSLGHKPFCKYEEWKQGPQFVVLSILKEIDELGPELEKIYNKEKI